MFRHFALFPESVFKALKGTDNPLFWPARIFMLSVIVMGLSVLFRIVKQGIPSAVVSSCRPPLSVITNEASFHKNSDSLSPSGGRRKIRSDNFMLNFSIIFFVRG